MTERDDDAVADVLSLVGNEVRAGILRVLGEARDREDAEATVPFSEIRSRLDQDVRSSRFNYHLQELVGHFVETTEEGYRLRSEGTTLYHDIQAGRYDYREPDGPFETRLDCYFCGERVTATYESGEFRVACPGCGYQYDSSSRVPVRGVEDAEALFSRVDRYNRHQRRAFVSGVCPTCVADVDVRLVDVADAPFGDDDRREAFVHYDCPDCGNQEYLSVGERCLHDPVLAAFCLERGLDVEETPVWRLPFAATDRTLSVLSRDPWEAEVTVAVGGDELAVRVDDTANIVERRRTISE